MNRIFDTETVLKAGRAAAEIAKHGTREEKSGKFLPPPGWKGHEAMGRWHEAKQSDGGVLRGGQNPSVCSQGLASTSPSLRDREETGVTPPPRSAATPPRTPPPAGRR